MSLFEERSNHLRLVNFPYYGGIQPDELGSNNTRPIFALASRYQAELDILGV